MKIGFIDYFLSEWHANNYPAWIAECAKKTGGDFELAYAYAEIDKSPYDGITTGEWCKKFNAEKCQSIDELCKKSDFIFILSPDNPEKHLEYCQKAFKHKKPAYVDKTFAPNLSEAKRIYELAEEYNTPFFSSSALGFADELKTGGEVNSLITTGGGGSLAVYIIHQLEMIVSLMGVGAKEVMSVLSGNNASIHIAYDGGRNALLNYGSGYGFTLSVDVKGKSGAEFKPVGSPFFQNMLTTILNFFSDGIPPVSKEHTLEVMALRDACLKSQDQLFKRIKV